MVLSTKFKSQPTPAIVSYSFIDIASGTGVQQFFGANSTALATFLLAPNQNLYSESVMTITENLNAGATGGFIKHMDIDFDVVLNTPRTIKGTFYANVPYIAKQMEAASATVDTYVIVKLRKWDGSTETEIANGQGYTKRSAIGPQYNQEIIMATIGFDISTATRINKGETLRCTVEVWGSVISTGGSYKLAIGHDPKNRAFNEIDEETLDTWSFLTDPSTLIFNIPFLLDLL